MGAAVSLRPAAAVPAEIAIASVTPADYDDHFLRFASRCQSRPFLCAWHQDRGL